MRYSLVALPASVASLPAQEQPTMGSERPRTEADCFGKRVEARRYRAEAWFVEPTDRIELCKRPAPRQIDPLEVMSSM